MRRHPISKRATKLPSQLIHDSTRTDGSGIPIDPTTTIAEICEERLGASWQFQPIEDNLSVVLYARNPPLAITFKYTAERRLLTAAHGSSAMEYVLADVAAESGLTATQIANVICRHLISATDQIHPEQQPPLTRILGLP